MAGRSEERRLSGPTVPLRAPSTDRPPDAYLALTSLAAYSGLSVRKLRDYLQDSVHPLPCYRVGGKILVRRSEFDTWVTRFRVSPAAVQVGAIVDDVLQGFR
jgi:hypothetical protein